MMRSINRCFNKQLEELCQHSMQLEELSNKVAQLLPANLAAHCQVGSFNKGCLVLTTTDATWASQLRYAIPELRDKLRKDGGMYQLLSIKINIIEPATKPHKSSKPQQHNELSSEAKVTIIRESQQCSYQPLQKALLRLART